MAILIKQADFSEQFLYPLAFDILISRMNNSRNSSDLNSDWPPFVFVINMHVQFEWLTAFNGVVLISVVVAVADADDDVDVDKMWFV